MSEYRPELFVKEFDASDSPLKADRYDRLSQARQTISRIERRDRTASLTGAVLTTGFGVVDTALPRGGLAFGGVHEILGLGARRFAVRLLRQRLAQCDAPALWIVPAGAGHSLYGPGMAKAGVDPNRVVIVRARNTREGLWTVEEALKSGAFALVLGELDTPVGQTAARRLQLAAEAGPAMGLLLSEGCRPIGAPGSVTSRWRAEPAPSLAREANVVRRLSLHLERHRGLIGDGAHWMVEGL